MAPTAPVGDSLVVDAGFSADMKLGRWLAIPGLVAATVAGAALLAMERELAQGGGAESDSRSAVRPDGPTESMPADVRQSRHGGGDAGGHVVADASTGNDDHRPTDLHLNGFLVFEPIPTERIRNIVSAAEVGNPEAQYSMAKLLYTCRYSLETYPDEAALAEFVARAGDVNDGEFAEGLQREVRACWDLRDAGGHLDRTAEEWMMLAAEGGYGPALAAMGGAYAWGATSLDPGSPHVGVEPAQMRRTLVAAAVGTRHPEALFAVHGFFGRQGPMHRGKLGEDLAWIYAACHFGLECGPDNWMLQWMCRWEEDCDQAYAASLPAYLEYKHYSPAEQDYAARRAPELIRALEEGDWAALGLELQGDPAVEEALEQAAALHDEFASEIQSLRSESDRGNP